ncbi:MAG TPA: hypothetical protein VGR15_09220 [Bacteroidota bacterium]|nr:hypothetical protein [Bacteroidota bacterium]
MKETIQKLFVDVFATPWIEAMQAVEPANPQIAILAFLDQPHIIPKI